MHAFLEHLLCAGRFSEQRGENNDKNKDPCPRGAASLPEKEENNKDNKCINSRVGDK